MKTINLKDNSSFSVPERDIESCLFLRNIANRTLEKLLQEPGNNLLAYPHSLKECKDLDGSQQVLSLQETDKDGKCVDLKIQTYNIAGFIGKDGCSVSIGSRFSDSNKQNSSQSSDPEKEDYFLHYMFEKTLGLNLFDLPHSTSQEQIFNLLLFLFPKFLNEALRQGLYREYQRNEYNDAHIRGSIDISRHIRLNMPFNGRIAYRTREYSQDNSVTELIRHTIEYIRSQKIGKPLLERDEETRANVSRIIASTSRYSRNDRQRVVSNQKAINHPYFTCYKGLQSLCLKILRHEEIKYGNSDKAIYGILFDVSYLWEEYLATLLIAQGFKHPENRIGTGRIYLAKENKFSRYPDFYNEEGTIIDAKYKPMVEEDDDQCKIKRNDLNQLITYMYRLKGKYGVLVHPIAAKEVETEKTYSLCGYGEEEKAEIKVYSFPIPQDVKNYEAFRQEMQASETQFLQSFSKQIFYSI